MEAPERYRLERHRLSKKPHPLGIELRSAIAWSNLPPVRGQAWSECDE
jgi:hypothetical protein